MRTHLADLSETERAWYFGLAATFILALFFSLPTY